MRKRFLGIGFVLLCVLTVPAGAHYIGLIYYPPALDESGSLYVSGTDGILYALHSDGSPRWAYNASAELTTPAVTDDSRVVVATINGRVIAVRQTNGTEIWETRLQTQSGRSVVRSLTIGQRAVYAVTAQAVHALDPSTGDERWEFAPGGEITAVAVGSTDRIYVTTSTDENGTLYALTSTGDRRWERTYSASVTHPATGSDGNIYVAVGNRLHALASNGSEIWTRQVGDVWRAPDVRNSRLVVGTFEGRVIVIEHGEVEWTYTTGEAVAPAFGPDAQRVYAVTSRSVLALEDGSQRWRTEIGATVLLPPTVGQNHIYVGTQLNRTYALSTNGSIAWIDQYATPFGAFVDVPEDVNAPEFLANATGSPTRIISKYDGIQGRAGTPPTTQTQLPGFDLVLTGTAFVILVLLLIRFYDQ